MYVDDILLALRGRFGSTVERRLNAYIPEPHEDGLLLMYTKDILLALRVASEAQSK